MDTNPTGTINDLPAWLSAIGTLLAVIVALYLARRDRRIQCVTNTTVYVLLDSANPGAPAEFVALTVTNVGTRVFTLSSIYWRMGIFKNTHFFMIPPPNEYSSRLPAKLTDGEQASFYFPLENFKVHTKSTLLEKAPKHFRRIWIWFTRVVVQSTTGDSFKFRVNKTIRQELRGVYKRVT